MRSNTLLKKLFLLSLSLSFTFVVAGCCNKATTAKKETEKKVTVNVKQDLLEDLDSYIVKLPEKNNQTMVIAIPRNDLFVAHSANFKEKSFPLLNDIAKLLSYYEKESVEIINPPATINGTNVKSSREAQKINNALTKKQGEKVIDYFWQKNINAPLIYAAHNKHYMLPKKLQNDIIIQFENLPKE